MKKISRLLALLLSAALLATACTKPNVDPVVDVTETGWMEGHSVGIPQAELNDESKRNIELGQALYQQLLENPPIDFLYDGVRFSENLSAWKMTAEDGENGKIVRYSYDGVVVKLSYTVYDDSPAVEWKLRIENTGSGNSKIISEVKSLSMSFETKSSSKVLYSKGGNATATDFQPITKVLKTGEKAAISSNGGRSSSGMMPYFNFTTGTRGGYIAAIGWTGQWKASVDRTAGEVVVNAGIEDSNFYLMPGEDVMLPSMILLPWEGDMQNSQNDFRRYILNHQTQKNEDGTINRMPLSVGIWGSSGTDNANAQAKGVTNRELGYDVLWIDAGWYGDGTTVSSNTFDDVWYKTAGTWTDIKELYPNGISEVASYANEKGLGFLLWFEPERANKDSQIAKEHSAWMLSNSRNTSDCLVNLGNPEAREWLTEYISSLIKEYGVNIYREDFNIEPLAYWRQADEPDRKGIAEMKYIEGLYLYWEGLLENCPGLIIDNCASGGRRLDYEALSRCAALSRSDYQCYSTTSTAEGCQMQVYGINFWLPLTGTITMGRTDSYNWRSNLSYGIQTPNVLTEYKAQKLLSDEYLEIRKYMIGDYYPMIECEPGDEGWFAFQMHRSDLNSGFVCAFRRLYEEKVTVTLKFSGLQADKNYEITVTDTGEVLVKTGAQLMNEGLVLTIENAKDSRLITYKITQ